MQTRYGPAMDYISSKFVFDSSSHFPLECRQTDATVIHASATAGIMLTALHMHLYAVHSHLCFS